MTSTTTEADSLLKEIVSRQNVELDFAGDLETLVSKIIEAAQVAVNHTLVDCVADGDLQARRREVLVREIAAQLAFVATPTPVDIFHAIEAQFVRDGDYSEAQAVTYMLSRRDGDLDPQVRLVRRSRQIVPWSVSKIESAVRRAFISIKLDPSPAVRIADAVTVRVKADANSLVGIEDVQDMVQEELMRQGHYSVATHYIRYRDERAKLRSEPADEGAPALSEIMVQDGRSTKPFDPVELRRRISFASTGLDLCLSKKEITKELMRSVGKEISKEDLKNTIILNAKTLLEKDADFGKFAGRILLTYIYEEVLEWDILRDGLGRLKQAHRAAFAAKLQRGVKIGRIDPDMLKRYDLGEMAAKLDPSADMDFDYLGLQTLYDRYLLVDKTGKKHVRLETPQFFWMRVAMGLFKEETGSDLSIADPADKRTNLAAALYNLYKSRRFCSSTPTLFNSGTPHSQLSSCYISVVDDNIESIMQRGIADSAYMAKFAGGLGGSWTNIRGTGAHIKGTNGESQGVIPFLKIYNDMLNAVNQGGKRKGSGCIYLEVWHNDIEDFLELRKNVGDDRRRCHDTNTANWIPDLFMKRMEARKDWTLFRSDQVSDLHGLYGRAFEQRYEEYEALASAGKIWSKTVAALELWKSMLKALFETGHPWITFKDPCNISSPQDHCGVIHSSNLCCMTADQRVVTEAGILTVGCLYGLTARAETHACSPVVMGRKGPAQAGPMLLPRPNAPIVKIKTREGYSHKVTPDHKVWVKDVGWVEAQHLTPGDRLEIQQKEGMWGPCDSVDLAFVTGLVAGDGGIGASAYIDITEGKTLHLRGMIEGKVRDAMRGYGHDVFGPGNATDPDSPLEPLFADSAPSETNGVKKARLNSVALKRLLALKGVTAETKTKVPDFVWEGNREVVGAYLAGLLVTDGTIQANDELTTIQLGSVDLGHLEEVQILLANLGVKCSVRKMRDAGRHELPANDGTGALKEYDCQAMHRLLITSQTACRIVETATRFGNLRGHRRFLENLVSKTGYKQKMWATFEELELLPNEDAYCLTVDNEDHDWTVNGMITKNTEITLNTSADEIAVCNLGSVVIEEHLLPNGEIDHPKLEETVTLAVRALDNVIDINFYPVPATQLSNSRHRPIGLGMMGLQNALHRKGLAFASQEAVEFSDEIAEAIAFYAYKASSLLAHEKGKYSTYEGSKWSRGILPQDTINLLAEERQQEILTPRGGKLNWEPVRQMIQINGMRNSNVMAIAPTACVTPETLVSGPEGLFAMEEIGDMDGTQWQSVSHDVHQSVDQAEATKFYLNGHRKVRLVRTSLGHQTRGTDTHRLKVLMPSGELDWKYLPDLEPGDLVAHKLGGFNPSALVGLQASVTGEHHNAAPVTLPETLDGPLACFLGAYMANGYIKYKTSGVPEGIKISLTNNKTATLQELRDTGAAWGVYTGDEEGQGQTTLCFYSRELAEWFVANGWAKPRGNRGEGSAGACIPVEVRRSPVAVVGAFLRGLFTDGTLGFQPSGAPCLEYSTVSGTLAYQLHALLWAMGFMAKRSTAEPGTLGERTVHRIRLSNVYSTREFLKACGWHSGAARNRAMEHGLKHDGYRGMGVTGFPLIAEIAAIIEAPNPELGRELRGAMATAKAQGSIGWHLLQRLATAEPKVKTTAAWRYLQDGVVLLPVVENEEEPELQPTCDLEVPGNHEYVAGGMVNHNTISNIMGTTPCIEPNYKNLFVKSNMSGDFTVLSETLVRELKVLGLWNQGMLDQLKYYDGELTEIAEIPDEVKTRHLTVFGIPYSYVIDAAARRQKWIDQSQSVNLFLPEANLTTMSRMYRHAWSSGLKTTYYLRTLQASGIEKSTIDAGKTLRGVMAESAPVAEAPVMQCRIDDPTCEACQ